MDFILNRLTDEVGAAFAAAGFDPSLGKVTVSNRPDLCEYQCNGAMAGAKALRRNPFEIAEKVAEALQSSGVFSMAEAVRPGFLNLKLSDEFLLSWLTEMDADERLGSPLPEKQKTIIVDYGGPNVAKPLHIGHLRAAIIGESVKRMGRFLGHNMIGDIHMGDWGLQMGLIIALLKERQPELCYFDPAFTGPYPEEAPFTLSELEEIYPAASAKSKEDPEFHAKAMQMTHALQRGEPGCRAIWEQIVRISVEDLKKNYERLNVYFDLWKGESDADPYIADMVKSMKEEGFAYESDGALVVDVAEEEDSTEVPPCMILKSDGAALYTTTDLATLVEREKDYHPDQIIYVVDKRQQLHFTQVFRTAKKTGILPESTKLDFLGFGTMNGKGGRALKTRDGGVMRLEQLINDVDQEMYRKMKESEAISLSDEEAASTARIVAVSAIKYGDLSNQAGKDYIFDIDKFTSFEGNTGPYIMYTIVRIKSILRKYSEKYGDSEEIRLSVPRNPEERALMLSLTGFAACMQGAFSDLAPHRVCAFLYETANAFNRFYHVTKIITEEDGERRRGWIGILRLTLRVLSQCIEVLGMEAPERM